ncbi:EPIDERMAL PATTERNING FACTOR-like protein 1 [Lolium rigidum]|uniref:EPIDERMAL PATTERNING FACTOR-like protein 1 n=1 Tax=Lolium rigidum TaxID=89674 RepID=UPI001F5CAE36|nr:EPIDERMAL PATTERNING FACTOR-like protein 1 [Lolium rigidum]
MAMSKSPLRAFLAAMVLSFLLGAATCSRTTTTLSSFQNLAEDKSRLGSTPPSCHNRCNACNPCKPIQVATTLPSGSSRPSTSRSAADEAAAYAQYSNYKPLGWKCRCAGRLYNP